MKYSKKKQKLITPPYWMSHVKRFWHQRKEIRYSNEFGTPDHVSETLYKEPILLNAIKQQMKRMGLMETTITFVYKIGERTVQPVYDKSKTKLIHPANSVFAIIEKRVRHYFR